MAVRSSLRRLASFSSNFFRERFGLNSGAYSPVHNLRNSGIRGRQRQCIPALFDADADLRFFKLDFSTERGISQVEAGEGSELVH